MQRSGGDGDPCPGDEKTAVHHDDPACHIHPLRRPARRDARGHSRDGGLGHALPHPRIPFVLFGVLVVNVLYLAGVIGALADLFEPLFVTWFGVPKETVGPLIAAFLRKDLAVAQLSAIAMTPYQMITAVVLVSIYFPCVATFVVMLREGWKELAAAVAVLVAAVFIYGGLIHAAGILMGVA
ncbi:nucleoside recognition domain-containing protein [Methanoculleus receptaculi]|uniref:Nucleoside recognition domain-containing protein n=1 Tax=Methanoculleus receptaculi TaxID=394967 RepID=A0AAX4FZ97_9EURY|nr:nucleoside recognition domain-containing protein [Methanoculleus receptaculi]WOX58681.1 nucleoside recognition domain-containing protein [Methanoculleus receptaculi]